MIFSLILNLHIKRPSVQNNVAFFCDTPSAAIGIHIDFIGSKRVEHGQKL